MFVGNQLRNTFYRAKSTELECYKVPVRHHQDSMKEFSETSSEDDNEAPDSVSFSGGHGPPSTPEIPFELLSFPCTGIPIDLESSDVHHSPECNQSTGSLDTGALEGLMPLEIPPVPAAPCRSGRSSHPPQHYGD